MERRILAAIGGVVAIVAALILGSQVICGVDAGEIVVKQSIGGELEVWSNPGWHWQGFGSITRYERTGQYAFKAPPERKAKEGEEAPEQVPDESIHIRFNDQGAASLSGSVSFDLPTDEALMTALHKKFRSSEGIRKRLIEPALTRSVYNSGPLMSSRESAGARRGDLIFAIQEQASRGVYKTVPRDVEVEDLLAPPVKSVATVQVPELDENGAPKIVDGKPVMKAEAQTTERPAMKRVVAYEPAIDPKGVPIVQEKSPIAEFGIRLYNITIERVIYEGKVQEQINKQRDMEMAIQTKIAEAKQAQQDVVTTEKKGQADAAKAKWEQEVQKATALTKAEQEKAVALMNAARAREVAAQDLEAAKLERQAAVERARGESEAKKLILDADGALAQKLEAYVAVQKAYAAEMGKQRWVPDVVMGSGSANGGAAVDMMQMLQVKAARDLALDLGVKR